MADYQIGDRPTLTYTLRDPITGALTDATVVATAVLLDSTGNPTTTTAPVTVTHLGTGTYGGTFDPSTSPGVWRVTFNATGALVEESSADIYVPADAALPPWAPTLRQVGTFVPSRTRLVGTDTFDNTYSGTFSDQTQPTDEQVSSLIGQACAWVTGPVGFPIVPAAYGPLQVAAAIRAAAWVEMTYPDRDAGINLATELLAQAEQALVSARNTNLSNGGGGSEDVTGEPVSLVTWSFPTTTPPLPKAAYFDRPIY